MLETDQLKYRLEYGLSISIASTARSRRFTAEIAIVLRWKDPRLTHTGSGIVRYPLEQVWHPRIAVVNETNSVSRKFPDLVEVEPDGRVTYRQRYAGSVYSAIAVAIIPVRPANVPASVRRGSLSD